MQSIPDVNTNEVSLFYFPVQPELNIIKDSFPFFLFSFFEFLGHFKRLSVIFLEYGKSCF